jgi:hypothetical protein
MYVNAGVFTASTATEGASNAPVYLNAGVLTEISALDTAHGGTGATAHTGNCLVWSSANGATLKADAHYASATKIAVNSTAEPSYNFYVNGSTGKVSGKAPVSGWKVFFTILLGLGLLSIPIIAGIIAYLQSGGFPGR